ncbi:MAG: tRNA (guanosine(37)-N1)-methyltransferase TrmD, partial [Xanthomonadales bacterium]|nr:tRNA (guanosine(37)-N1)-methyltransferase TrmD [Xanthomonadales bacterium]
ATDNHRTVDGRPFGGGPGMLMTIGPLRDAIASVRSASAQSARVVYMSPQGARLTQEKVLEFARMDRLILVCGRYEGVDERVLENLVDEEVSIGDYVLSGG